LDMYSYVSLFSLSINHEVRSPADMIWLPVCTVPAFELSDK
jgi:hypothetical protein